LNNIRKAVGKDQTLSTI